ncbi:HGL236Cp [Eremothecium sinecaudum]|uniref:Nascent polypeptide-associated complex subunit alpha n=1 Tax=Eremothecium sinecaudum TaxID=45286 RepID=A0A0X8HVC1_9SACH|nr:HGL236Cp [Eremothecium sinecaudum]AMD22104.1 HGL236Cp [Eremothecium sinecaudum]
MSEIPEDSQVSIFSRNERKAREIIKKLGLKQVTGISRVTFRKKNNQIFAIDHPEVFKSHGGNYVVFGEPKVDDFTRRLAKAQQHAAAASKDEQEIPSSSKDAGSIQADMLAAAEKSSQSPSAEASAPSAGASETEQVDETGLDADDIDLVMQQANVSRSEAINALRKHDQDIVNAIMSFSR